MIDWRLRFDLVNGTGNPRCFNYLAREFFQCHQPNQTFKMSSSISSRHFMHMQRPPFCFGNLQNMCFVTDQNMFHLFNHLNHFKSILSLYCDIIFENGVLRWTGNNNIMVTTSFLPPQHHITTAQILTATSNLLHYLSKGTGKWTNN